MLKISHDELSMRLNKNGWAWHMISTLTPGVVRIQMADDGEEETGWRECVEAPTLQEAVDKAEKLVDEISADDFFKKFVRSRGD